MCRWAVCGFYSVFECFGFRLLGSLASCGRYVLLDCFDGTRVPVSIPVSVSLFLSLVLDYFYSFVLCFYVYLGDEY